MEIIRPSSLAFDFLNENQNGIPLFICTDAPRVKKKLDEAGYKAIGINACLSEALLKYPAKERPNNVESELRSLLNYQAPLLIIDFEMLFDPRYSIDVIKFFCERARTANIAIKWPGRIADSKLSYAEPGNKDYHEYDCNSYQIRIVK